MINKIKKIIRDFLYGDKLSLKERTEVEDYVIFYSKGKNGNRKWYGSGNFIPKSRIRTPILEEFVLGFEYYMYEVYADEWVKKKMHKNNFYNDGTMEYNAMMFIKFKLERDEIVVLRDEFKKINNEKNNSKIS